MYMYILSLEDSAVYIHVHVHVNAAHKHFLKVPYVMLMVYKLRRLEFLSWCTSGFSLHSLACLSERDGSVTSYPTK